MIDTITEAFEKTCKRLVCAGFLWTQAEKDGCRRAVCLVCAREFPMRRREERGG